MTRCGAEEINDTWQWKESLRMSQYPRKNLIFFPVNDEPWDIKQSYKEESWNDADWATAMYPLGSRLLCYRKPFPNILMNCLSLSPFYSQRNRIIELKKLDEESAAHYPRLTDTQPIFLSICHIPLWGEIWKMVFFSYKEYTIKFWGTRHRKMLGWLNVLVKGLERIWV